ncbi:hypothetical protein, partial [Streptococcus sp. DD11]|uniref:hypothetical protein n=1 Tax=Streptococcus sp. DD11 TaxID=1777879 RepID=UPI0019D060B2
MLSLKGREADRLFSNLGFSFQCFRRWLSWDWTSWLARWWQLFHLYTSKERLCWCVFLVPWYVLGLIKGANGSPGLVLELCCFVFIYHKRG